MTKKISFSVTDKQYKKIFSAAESEGLTVSAYAKRRAIMAANSSWEGEVKNNFVYDSGLSITQPFHVLNLLGDIRNERQEHFVVITLNNAYVPIQKRIVFKGTVDSCAVHPREVFADAITDRAKAIIIAHNHPSGNLTPSVQDIKLTKKIKDASDIIGIKLLDHIIVGGSNYLSMNQEGHI